MSAERARSAVEASHRSIHPNIAGVPWWAAVLTAIAGTTMGYAIDAASGHQQLTYIFAGLYIAGCVAAVLAVRRQDLFTAIIQPPLILFCAVPVAYWLFHGRTVGHLKDLAINCGYPLIERFPLMLGAAGAVLLIGLIRWYSETAHRTTMAAGATDPTTAQAAGETNAKSLTNVITAKLNALLGIHSAVDDADGAASARARRTRATSRQATSKTGRATRSRRQPVERREPGVERAGRRRQAVPRDFDHAEPPRRSRRRPRPHQQETHRESRTRRNPYGRPVPHSGARFGGSDADLFSDLYVPYEASYPPYQPSHDLPRRRRAGSGGPNVTNPTHHPISRVRYRGSAPAAEPGDEPGPEQ